MTLTRIEMAARVAQDIPNGSIVNLGIGAPTLVADCLPEGREIVLHTENGLLGMGPAAEEEEINENLINAGKQYVTEVPGAAYFHHADSFAMMRGGHLDYCILGAYQISRNGDIANWRTNSKDDIPGVGGAMDLVYGARRVYVMMNLFTKAGESKLIDQCTYPLTGVGCVDRIYTDHAVFELANDEVHVIDIFGSTTMDDLSSWLDIPLRDALPTKTV